MSAHGDSGDRVYDGLALSRATVDRAASERADPDVVPRALADAATRVLTLRGERAAVRGGRLELRSPRPTDVDARPWFLGRDSAGVAHLAVLEPEESPACAGGDELAWSTLRELGTRLDDREVGLLTAATALARWHERHGHCPRCGAETQVGLNGWVRTCPRDGSEHHPRTDPAVIMAVTDDADRLLLAAGAGWPTGRMSVLAGFVEAGESLESAVVREVAEEVGLAVEQPRYRGNQPWPFPASLMLAFTARARGTMLRPDPAEIAEARWFTREELAGAVREGAVTLPSQVSIARRLVEEWYGAPLAPPGDDR